MVWNMKPKETIGDRFTRFHADNPKVYEALVRLARIAKSKGHKTVGMKMLFEVVRWEVYLETTDPNFKLNNVFTSRYARLIMKQEKDLADFFETRELKSL